MTLIGPGGVGKTRLAVHLAELLRPTFPDGVAFVPLAQIRNPELVPDEIARALRLPAAPYAGPDGVTRLAEHLRERRVLLVLDNVEQLADGADVIAALLQAAPEPRVLATSRGPLHLREEQRYPVEPLSHESAVEEFAERARSVRPDLVLGPADRESVARIVDGVGRLPLAVELAAARVGTLRPDEIADRLDSQLGLLRSGPRDLPRRQQALRSTLLWSYDLLDEPARRTFAVFAVFPGGATLDALEAVLPTSRDDPLDAVSALVDQGLVRRGSDGSARFTTLQAVRELAGELLEKSDEGPAVWRRAAERLARLARLAAPNLVTAERAGWLDRLQAEHDNLRVALAWATEHDAVLGADIAAPPWRYWQMRGYLREGRAALESLLARLGPDDLAARYAIEAALGGVAYWQRDLSAGEAACAAAVQLAEQMQDPAALAEAVYNLAFPIWQQGRMEEAQRLADRSEQLFTDLGDADGTARTLWLHGILAVLTGDLDTAERLLTQSVDRTRGTPAVFQLGWSLRMLGRTLLLQRRPEEARRRIEESLRLFAPAGDVSAVVLHLADFATLAALEGDPERELRLAGALRHLKRLSAVALADHPVNAVPGLEETVAARGRGRRPAAGRRSGDDGRGGRALRPPGAVAGRLSWQDDRMLLADVVAVSAAVAATRARTAKARSIAELLGQAGADEVEPVTAWLAGEPRQGRTGVGSRTVSKHASDPAADASLTVAAVDGRSVRAGDDGRRGLGARDGTRSSAACCRPRPPRSSGSSSGCSPANCARARSKASCSTPSPWPPTFLLPRSGARSCSRAGCPRPRPPRSPGVLRHWRRCGCGSVARCGRCWPVRVRRWTRRSPPWAAT